jgi:hypothetical protein
MWRMISENPHSPPRLAVRGWRALLQEAREMLRWACNGSVAGGVAGLVLTPVAATFLLKISGRGADSFVAILGGVFGLEAGAILGLALGLVCRLWARWGARRTSSTGGWTTCILASAAVGFQSGHYIARPLDLPGTPATGMLCAALIGVVVAWTLIRTRTR